MDTQAISAIGDFLKEHHQAIGDKVDESVIPKLLIRIKIKKYFDTKANQSFNFRSESGDEMQQKVDGKILITCLKYR